MKTQIIQLEPHDDVISARDKMGWSQTSRILLVWPERGRILARRLDLTLLARHSNLLGAQLALITNDPDVRFHARQLGIPLYKSLRKAQNAHWRVPRRFRRTTFRRMPEWRQKGETQGFRSLLPERPDLDPRPLSPVARLAAFTIGVFALLSIAAVLLPTAQVNLAPQVRTQEISLEVQAEPNATDINFSGIVPAHPKNVIVEGRDELPVSGSTLYPVKRASGYAHFTNLTGAPVTIPPGTVVLSTGDEAVRFLTIRAGTVPSGTGETLTLVVRAESPGGQGNLLPDHLQAIEGLLGTQLAVTNPAAISGGEDRRSPAPDASDQQRLKARLLASLQQAARDDLQSELSPDDYLIPSSLQLKETLEESLDPPQVQPADRLALYLRLEFQAQVVSGDDLRRLATGLLDAKTPSGFAALPGSLEIENRFGPGTGKNAPTTWNLYASRQLQAELPESQTVKMALGLTPAEAEKRLSKTLSLGAPPEISLFPSWWPRLPVIPFRISVSTAQNEQ